jgi:hypothetical protein
MSWHCLICGSPDRCNGLMYVSHIGGGIPKQFCVHLRCLAQAIELGWERRATSGSWKPSDVANELRTWEIENDGKDDIQGAAGLSGSSLAKKIENAIANEVYHYTCNDGEQLEKSVLIKKVLGVLDE